MNIEGAPHRIDSRVANTKGWVILAWQFPDADNSINRENDCLNCLSDIDTSSLDSSPKSIKNAVHATFITGMMEHMGS